MDSFKNFQELQSSRGGGGGGRFGTRNGWSRKRLVYTQIGAGTPTGPSQKSPNLWDTCGNKDDLQLARATNQNRPRIFEAGRQKVVRCCNLCNGVRGPHFEPFWPIN